MMEAQRLGDEISHDKNTGDNGLCGDEDSGQGRNINDWEMCAVSDSFIKNKAGRQNQIPAKDIAEVGRFPVVDQGQSLVAGYCNDESKVISSNLPLVIFGDHTRCFKYVDFPFVLGADGTKVLVPNRQLYDPKFYYFAMLGLELPSRGYNRHFKMLKERVLPRPSIPEQKKSRTSSRRCSERPKRRSGSFRSPPS